MNNLIYKLFLFIFIGIFSSQTVFAEDFTSRCTAPGVILCSGFDVDDPVGYTGDITPFIYGDDTGVIFPSLDTTQKSSGAGSVKFIIPTLSADNTSGALSRTIKESEPGFTAGNTFYVQFRQKFSPEMLNPTMGGEGWRQIIINSEFGGWYGDPMIIGLRNDGMSGQPKLFIGNEASLPQTPTDLTPVMYVTDKWMTFYFKITIGTWDGADSQIEVWASDGDTPLEQIYNLTDITLTQNSTEDGLNSYNNITLTPANLGKLAETDHTLADTWYDELIVSTSPIADSYTVVAPPADTTAPTAPGNFTATAFSTNQINLTWTFSTDAVGVEGYKIYKDGNLITTSTNLEYQNTGLDPSTTYNYEITAYDLAGNISATSTASATTQSLPDTTAPTTPSDLTATVISTSQINLTWASSTDTVGVAGYKIYRNGSQIATSTILSFSNTGLTSNTSYNFYISAFDNANNVSATSTTVSATTQAEPAPVVTPPPSGGGGGGGGGTFYPTPTTTFSASPTSINPGASSLLSWTSTNASSISIDQGIGSVSNSGSLLVKPATTTTYTLTATGPGGVSTNRTILTVSTFAPTQTASALLGLIQASQSTNTSNTSGVGNKIVTTESVNVRQVAGTFSPRLGMETIGKTGLIIDGPVTKDGYTWWKISYDSGLVGWSVGNYLSSATTVIPQTSSDKFQIRNNIITTNNVNVRQIAGITGPRVGVETIGKTGLIVDGPITKDGYTWWKISYNDGLVGWSAENYLNKTTTTPNVQTTGSFTRSLYFGMKNDSDVVKLQTVLQKENLFQATPTGNFFGITQEAVKKFQTKYGIPSTGYVGPLTRAKLNSL